MSSISRLLPIAVLALAVSCAGGKKTETAEEWICAAKTSRDQLAGIEELLKRIHRYEVPELIATPIVGGSEAYLKWLGEQLES